MGGEGGAPQGASPDCAARPAHPAAHVRHVRIGADTILLDLRRDRYLSIATEAFEALAYGRAGPFVAVREQMLRDDVFTDVDEVKPERTIARDWRLVTRVIVSCAWAHGREKSRRLDLAISELARMRVMMRDDGDRRTDWVSAFMDVRPWYPRRPVCLFESLALTHFLLDLGHRVQIVFGVRTHPFAAHAWVEADDRILYDEALYCASFTEILRAP